jgi:hypothetical protein
MKQSKTPKEAALYRVKLNCQIGKDALNGKEPMMSNVEPLEYAVFCLLNAVEDIAEAMKTEDIKNNEEPK